MPEGAQRHSNFYVAPDAVAVYKGYMIPGNNVIVELVKQLRAEIADNADLAQQWQDDPRSVLASRGIMVDLQSEVLKAEGIPLPEAMKDCTVTVVSGCCVTIL